MKSFFHGKKILVTGHTGFVGSWLTKILVGWGADVVGVSLAPHAEPNLFDVLKLKDLVTHYEVDITNQNELNKIFKETRPEIVFHLAAQALVRTSYDLPELTYLTNVIGTTNVLGAIRQTPSVRSGLIVTTDKVYRNNESGNPFKETDSLGGHDPYSASKAAADLITSSYIDSFFQKENSPFFAIVRSGNVFGGGDWAKDRLIPDIVRAVYQTNTPTIIRNPKSVRPWQHVIEPVAGYLLLVKKLFEGNKSCVGAWNFGPNDSLSCTVEEMTRRAVTLLGRGTFKVIPEVQKPEAGLLRLDCTKAKKQLGWEQKLDLETSLRWTFEWYREFYEHGNSLLMTEQQIEKYF
jgi:CDP-glucose 4,6-dehydratase